jgi:hypothetical protein
MVYQELEANVIEEWVVCGVDCCSSFVRTDLISAALPFHDKLAGPDVLCRHKFILV